MRTVQDCFLPPTGAPSAVLWHAAHMGLYAFIYGATDARCSLADSPMSLWMHLKSSIYPPRRGGGYPRFRPRGALTPYTARTIPIGSVAHQMIASLPANFADDR